MQPQKPIDLICLPSSARSIVEAKAFASDMREVQDEIRRNVALSNEKYKNHVDLRGWFIEYKEGNMVIICVRPKLFPKGAYKKLHYTNAGPYKIMIKNQF